TNAVTAVTVSDDKVELTLTTAIAHGQVVSVGYTDPTADDDANATQDAAGNDVASLSAATVTNNVADTTPPEFVSAETSTDGSTLTLTYDEALDASNTASVSDFEVLVDGSANAVTGVTVNGDQVELTLTTAIAHGQAVALSYTDPTADDVADATQGAAGNDVASLSAATGTNNVPDTPPPTLMSAATNEDGSKVILTYGEI